MDKNRLGAPLLDGTPESETANCAQFQANSSAVVSQSTRFTGHRGENLFSAQVRQQLAEYMRLGLVPIPLNGKQPLVKWTRWQPKSVATLEPFVRRGCDWGVKTGNGFVVVDFDTVGSYENFMANNSDKLPSSTPIVKTGRGYHVWIRTTKPVRTQHYEGIDIKSDGGYVVVPPSIHANGNQYRFIRPLSQEVPIVALDKLVLPLAKTDHPIMSTTPFKLSDWKPVPGHKVELINNGAAEGERHNGLVTYIGVMINEGRDKEWVVEAATLWNQMCRPPLPNEEVEATVESVWNAYAGRVSIKTLNSKASVFVETRRKRKEYAEAHTKFIEELKAKDKANELPHNDMCGKRHAITRQGRKYLSVVFFCGSWSCPRCADFFRRRWIDHLQEVTAGQPLYIMHTIDNDWGRLRRSLNRLGAEYAKVTVGDEITIILNQAIAGSEPLPQDNLGERLEALIPHEAKTCPISTSRGWQRAKKSDHNAEGEEKPELVTRTWLPLAIQTHIAKKLGARLDGDMRWTSPESEDAQVWTNKFTIQLEIHEQNMWSEAMKKGKLLETWLDEYSKAMEVEDVFEGFKERWEILAG